MNIMAVHDDHLKNGTYKNSLKEITNILYIIMKKMESFIFKSEIQVYNNILDKNICNKIFNTNDNDDIYHIISEWIGADVSYCIAKYKSYTPIIEFEYCSKNYNPEIQRIKSSQIRTYIHEHTREYLESIEWLEMFPNGRNISVKFYKENGKWTWNYYGTESTNLSKLF